MDDQIPAISPSELSNIFETGHKLSSTADNKKIFKIAQKIISRLSTDINLGLKSHQILQRRTSFGSNAPKAQAGKNFLDFLATQFKDFCVQVLCFSAIVVFALGFFTDNRSETWLQAITITLALVFVVALGSFTDYQKEKQFMKFFTRMNTKTVKVK